MELSSLLWKNWEKWANGGLGEDSIKELINESDLDILLYWIDKGYSQTHTIRPLLDLKTVVDVATWCLHGTHSLLLLPSDLRRRDLERTANSLGIPKDVLVWLVEASTILEAQI